METDLFTVQKSDIIDLVAEMMDWQKLRYAPVEDIKGNLGRARLTPINIKESNKKQEK